MTITLRVSSSNYCVHSNESVFSDERWLATTCTEVLTRSGISYKEGTKLKSPWLALPGLEWQIVSSNGKEREEGKEMATDDCGIGRAKATAWYD